MVLASRRMDEEAGDKQAAARLYLAQQEWDTWRLSGSAAEPEWRHQGIGVAVNFTR